MAHLVAASVEVKGDVAEEGNGNENDGSQVRRQSENTNKGLHLFCFACQSSCLLNTPPNHNLSPQ